MSAEIKYYDAHPCPDCGRTEAHKEHYWPRRYQEVVVDMDAVYVVAAEEWLRSGNPMLVARVAVNAAFGKSDKRGNHEAGLPHMEDKSKTTETRLTGRV